MDWRMSFYDAVRKKKLEDSLCTTETIKNLVYTEFTGFMDPIQDLAEITIEGEVHKYRVYDKILKVAYLEDKIFFSQISLTLSGNETKETPIAELFREGGVFLKKDERLGQPGEYISKKTIDSIFYRAFTHGSALRFRD
ncbi:hypothetical protein P4V64_31385 [Bacillus thuringiensis]|nr:hypothetical protein [Bacillus thuringiensis]